MRLAFTQQLGALGDPVPTVTHVMVHAQSNGTLLFTLTGTHFAPHAELLIDGRSGGMVSQSTSQQLVAVVSDAACLLAHTLLVYAIPKGRLPR